MECTRRYTGRQTGRYGRFLRYPVEIYPSRILTIAMPFCASTNRHCTCLFGPSGQKGSGWKKLELYIGNFKIKFLRGKCEKLPLPGPPGPIFRATRMSICSQVGIGPNNKQPKCHNHNH